MVASAPKQGTSSASGSKAVRSASAASSQRATMQRNLEVMTSGVANLELSSGPAQQSQRIKDRPFRVQAFSNKVAQYHAADLFDLESCTLDLAQCVNGLAPYLALQVGQTPSTSSKVAASGETSPSTVGDIISPLLLKIGGLHLLVDNRVHL